VTGIHYDEQLLPSVLWIQGFPGQDKAHNPQERQEYTRPDKTTTIHEKIYMDSIYDMNGVKADIIPICIDRRYN